MFVLNRKLHNNMHALPCGCKSWVNDYSCILITDCMLGDCSAYKNGSSCIFIAKGFYIYFLGITSERELWQHDTW